MRPTPAPLLPPRGWPFALVAAAFAAYAFVPSGLSAHLLAIFGRSGIDAGRVVIIGALFGPSQVLVRIADYGQSPQAACDGPRFRVVQGMDVSVEDDGFAPNDDFRQNSANALLRWSPSQNFSLGGLFRHTTFDRWTYNLGVRMRF